MCRPLRRPHTVIPSSEHLRKNDSGGSFPEPGQARSEADREATLREVLAASRGKRTQWTDATRVGGWRRVSEVVGRELRFSPGQGSPEPGMGERTRALPGLELRYDRCQRDDCCERRNDTR